MNVDVTLGDEPAPVDVGVTFPVPPPPPPPTDGVPRIDSIVPNSGPLAGGTPITITGVNFQWAGFGVSCNVDGEQLVAMVTTATTITGRTPPSRRADPHGADLVVGQPGDVARQTGRLHGFTYS